MPLYFVAGSLSFITKSVGGSAISSWSVTSYSLAFASIAPFSGYLQDVFGRRYISLTGSATLILGLILIGTTHTMTQVIVGMTISGVGAAIGELTALAGTSELVPVKNRGWYLGLVTGCILPFSPYPIYTTLLGTHATWRWGIWIALYDHPFVFRAHSPFPSHFCLISSSKQLMFSVQDLEHYCTCGNGHLLFPTLSGPCTAKDSSRGDAYDRLRRRDALYRRHDAIVSVTSC